MVFFGVLIYTLLFCFIIYKWNFFDVQSLKKRTLTGVFLLKVLFGFLLYAIYYYYYGNDRLASDAFHFYDDSLVLYNTLKNDPKAFIDIFFNIGDQTKYIDITKQMNFWTKPFNHGLINDNQTMIRTNFIFDLFSFGNYHIHTVFMSFLSFIGLTAIYKTFEKQFVNFPSLLFTSVFLVPSVLFWASGVLKEGLLLFALGLFVWCSFSLTTSFHLKKLIIALISLFILFTLKVYTLTAILPAFIGYFLIVKLKPKKTILITTLVHLSIITLLFIVPQLFLRYDFITVIAAKQRDFINVATTAGSAFDIPRVTDIYSLITSAPVALFNTLFRPFIWDATPIMLVNSIENIIFVLILVFAIIKHQTLDASQKNKLMFCLSFTMYLFLIIGWTTPVAGAIVRYKIPALPFLLIGAFLLLNKEDTFNKLPLLKKLNQLL